MRGRGILQEKQTRRSSVRECVPRDGMGSETRLGEAGLIRVPQLGLLDKVGNNLSCATRYLRSTNHPLTPLPFPLTSNTRILTRLDWRDEGGCGSEAHGGHAADVPISDCQMEEDHQSVGRRTSSPDTNSDDGAIGEARRTPEERSAGFCVTSLRWLRHSMATELRAMPRLLARHTNSLG
jgi:hypothetical protein